MPPAVSSRRRSRRDPSPDRIEEDQPSQHNIEEDVDEDVDGGEEEEAQPRRSAKSVKKEKQSRRKNEPQSDVKNEVKGRIDVENFQDQPLDRKEGQKLSGIASDWSMIRKNVHESAFSLMNDLASSMAEVVEDDNEQGGKSLTELDVIMRDLIDLQSEMSCYESTLEALHQKVVQGEEIDNVMKRYQEGLETSMAGYKKKTTRQKYGKNKDYANFKQAIFEVQRPGQAMPPITEFLPREDDDVSDEDEEIEVGGMTQDYRCPLSLTILVNPLTSKVCHHSFSSEAIRGYLGNAHGGKMKCPAAGCQKSIGLSDLEVDKDLEKRAKAAARRERRREEASDAEEVVE